MKAYFVWRPTQTQVIQKFQWVQDEKQLLCSYAREVLNEGDADAKDVIVTNKMVNRKSSLFILSEVLQASNIEYLNFFRYLLSRVFCFTLATV